MTPYYPRSRRVIQTDSDESSAEQDNQIVDVQMQVPQNSPEDEESPEHEQSQSSPYN